MIALLKEIMNFVFPYEEQNYIGTIEQRQEINYNDFKKY